MKVIINPIILVLILLVTVGTHHYSYHAENDHQQSSLLNLPLEIRQEIFKKFPPSIDFIQELNFSMTNKQLRAEFETKYALYANASFEEIDTFLEKIVQDLGPISQEKFLEASRSVWNNISVLPNTKIDIKNLCGKNTEYDQKLFSLCLLSAYTSEHYIPKMLLACLINWPSTQRWINTVRKENNFKVLQSDFTCYVKIFVIPTGSLITQDQTIPLNHVLLMRLISCLISEKTLSRTENFSFFAPQDTIYHPATKNPIGSIPNLKNKIHVGLVSTFLDVILFGSSAVQNAFFQNTAFITRIKQPHNVLVYQSLLELALVTVNHIYLKLLSELEQYGDKGREWTTPLKNALINDDFTLHTKILKSFTNNAIIAERYSYLHKLANLVLLINNFIGTESINKKIVLKHQLTGTKRTAQKSVDEPPAKYKK